MDWAWPKLDQLDTYLGLWEILAEEATWQILFVTEEWGIILLHLWNVLVVLLIFMIFLLESENFVGSLWIDLL